MKWYSSKLILLLISFSSIWMASNIHWGKDNWKGILESDAKGYYAYLPAFFIYQDPHFTFLDQIEEKYPNPLLYVDYRSHLKEGVVNKYYLGSAFLQTPFFLIAHGITLAQDPENADGYSKWYQILVSISGLFYLWLGLYFLRKSFQLIKLEDPWISLLLVATLFGTNLFVYAITDPAYSHIYSFGLISAFVYSALKFFQTKNDQLIYWMAACLGLIILVRPINALVVGSLPFLAGSWDELKTLFRRTMHTKVLFPSLLIVLLIPFLQLIYYYIATAHWWVYSYQEEGFHFADPHFIDILFSYKKGLFLYTPLYLLCFLGLIPLYRHDHFRFWTWLGFFFLITYVFSSWWMWYYGASFSSRVYVEYLPLFILLLGYFFKEVKSIRLRWSAVAVIILLVALCQIQIYQYRRYIIHYSEMTQERYWEVFLEW